MEKEKPLIGLRPKTDFEKLVWERQGNKMIFDQLRKQNLKLEQLETELKETKTKCAQEINEFKERMQKDNLGAVILKNKKLVEANHYKDIKLAEYKKKNEELFLVLAKINKPTSLKKTVDYQT